MGGDYDLTELDRRIPVRFHACGATDALPVVLRFSVSPDPELIERLHEIAVGWATVGVNGGFGGALHVFPGGPSTGLAEEPEFRIGGDAEGFCVEMILDFGSAPFDSIQILLRALRNYALLFEMPMSRIDVGEILDS